MKEGSQTPPFGPIKGSNNVLFSEEDYSEGSQPEDENPFPDREWTVYVGEDSEEEKPKMHIRERIKLMDEEEKRRYEEAQSRGLPTIPDGYVPVVVKKPTKEEQEAKYKAWREKLARIKREKEAFLEESRKNARRQYEMYARIQKDNRTRDYYWKPDPLYSLHLRDLGYSKIAIDKALFYVDNKSVNHALRYLKENPNPTELTKEEVMAVGEEVLKRIRPVRPPDFDPFKVNSTEEDEMDIEPSSQPIGGDLEKEIDFSVGLKISASSPSADEPKEEVKEEDNRKRGVKRNYHGEEVKVIEQTNEEVTEPVLVELPQHQMIFVSNTALMMDAITLSLEVSKVAVKIMDQLIHGDDEWNKMQEEWMKDGSTMIMYKGNNNSHMYTLQKEAENHGYINYMAERSYYRSVKTTSPTVLGIFAEKKRIRRIAFYLEKL